MTERPTDPTMEAARREEQTVTADGRSVATTIAGVKTSTPVNHVDHRGRVFEIFTGADEFWDEPVVYCYAFTIRPQQVKGWGVHERKADRYTLISGEMLAVLYDARPDSPTHGLVQRVVLTPQGVRQLFIPSGVWHVDINLGADEAILVNHPTEVYHHAQPDRLLLPWDTDDIPVDLREYFPIKYAGPILRDAD